MFLIEAESGNGLAGAERSAGDTTVLIHRSRQGSHLTRYILCDAGPSQPQRWVFPNLYDLLVFARMHGFAEVDAKATDWRTVSSLV